MGLKPTLPALELAGAGGTRRAGGSFGGFRLPLVCSLTCWLATGASSPGTGGNCRWLACMGGTGGIAISSSKGALSVIIGGGGGSLCFAGGSFGGTLTRSSFNEWESMMLGGGGGSRACFQVECFNVSLLSGKGCPSLALGGAGGYLCLAADSLSRSA